MAGNENEKLVDALGRILESDDFQFRGEPFYFSTHAAYTNPCLSVTGLGLIGLPLSDRDAEAIKTSEWSYYSGDAIWSIDADNIVFENPQQWEDFVQSEIMDVYQDLGINSSVDDRLDRLLLVGPGSSINEAFPNTAFQDELIANILIILPSKYDGGEIRLASYSGTETLSFSSSCLTETSFLGWYSNLPCDIQPITSGHRLMLSYKIIKPSSTKVIIPDIIRDTDLLRPILQKWHRREYRELPISEYVLYRLVHENSISTDTKGKVTLKGEDSYKVGCLRSAANETGYRICLVSFGEPNLVPDHILNHGTLLFDVNKGTKLPHYGLYIHADSIIPSSKSKYQVTSKSAASHESSIANPQPAPRVAAAPQYGILMFHEDNEETAFLGFQRIATILDRLRELISSSEVTEKELMVGRYATDVLKARMSGHYVGRLLIDYALKIEDIDTWMDGVEKMQHQLGRDDIRRFLKATQLFGFNRVRESLQYVIVLPHNRLSVKVNLLCELHNYACRQDKTEEMSALEDWCKTYIHDLMAGPLLDVFEDCGVIIGTLRNVVREYGMQYLEKIELGSVAHVLSFLPFLAKCLRTADSPDEKMIIEYLSASSVGVIIRYLSYLDYQNEYSDTHEYVSPGRTERQRTILQFFLRAIAACIRSHFTDQFEELLNIAIDDRGCSYTRVLHFYMPLTEYLLEGMESMRQPLASLPLVKLLRTIIWEYLNAMLGTKSINPRLPLPRIGLRSRCQCEYCVQLDAFMLQPHLHRFYLEHLTKSKMKHVLLTVKKGGDLLDFVASGGTLDVMKRARVVACARWEVRLNEANEFIRRIATKETIKEIMGSDYDEFRKAMRGEDTPKLRKWSPEEIERRNLELWAYEEETYRDPLSMSKKRKTKREVDFDSTT